MASRDTDPDENQIRRFKRIPIVSHVDVTLPDNGEVYSGLVENVNRGGMGIYSERPLPAEKTVRLSLTFLDIQGERVKEECRGTIVTVTPKEKGYIVGIAFSEPLNPFRNPNLYAYVDIRDEFFKH